MRLGLIGFGNIGSTLVRLMDEAGLRPAHLTVLVRPGREGAVQDVLGGKVTVVTDAAALLADAPDLVVECAGHPAVQAHVPALLRAGVDVVQVSVGAMADEALASELRQAARAGDARLILPPGAVGGVDLLSALSASGTLGVTYHGIKPPMAWAGTPAEQACDLASLTERTVFFRGTSREAAREFPKNANVAATLALAGAGFEATRVELVADPAAPGNIHAYEVRSAMANFRVEIENLPSTGNVKTSVSTVYSVLREIRNRMENVVI
jgi:aspartate dehydrogenase